MIKRVEYDEFSYFQDNASEVGLPWNGPPEVARRFVNLADGRRMSALVWGSKTPEVMFLHGGSQNAHTWDTVALALGEPLIAMDLPGHGHADGGANGSVNPWSNADDVAAVIRELAAGSVHLVGMSLGGLTSLAVADAHPDLVKSVLLVDITPGVTAEKSSMIADFVSGPKSFANFDELLARTIQYNPTRTESSLRRGILHNAEQLDDGTWRWRYSRMQTGGAKRPEFSVLWEALSHLKVPLCLARGMLSQSVVDDADEAEVLQRQPGARIEHFPDAGHSLQGDTPIELAALVGDFTGVSGA